MKRSLSTAWLSHLWWVLFPLFALLVGELTRERLAGITADDWLGMIRPHPELMWIVALVYAAAHVWCAACYAFVVRRSVATAASRATRGLLTKLVPMCGLLLLEYCPAAWWRFAHHLLQAPS